MLHNEAGNLLVEAYEKTHDAKGIALTYGVSVPTVYRLAEQKAKTGSVDLRVSKRGRKRVLGQDALEKIAKTIDAQPDITLAEIVEKLELPVGIETVRRAIQAMGYRRKENNGAGFRKQPRHPFWFSWMKVAFTTFQGGTTGDKFLTYLNDVLIPALHPGDIVVMDNLRTHHIQAVGELLHGAGVDRRVLFCPGGNRKLFAFQLSLEITTADES